GRVTEVVGRGRPLAGVTITVRNMLDDRETTAFSAEDGAFTIAHLSAGVYAVMGSKAGFSIDARTVELQSGEQRQTELAAILNEDSSTLGILSVVTGPLREQFDASTIAMVAEVGPSVVVSREDEMVWVLTDLHVESLFKGVVPRGGVTYRHAEYEKAAEGPGPWRAEFTPGTHVLALLEPSHQDDLGARRKPVFESVEN